jgi:hypothetical protein
MLFLIYCLIVFVWDLHTTCRQYERGGEDDYYLLLTAFLCVLSLLVSNAQGTQGPLSLLTVIMLSTKGGGASAIASIKKTTEFCALQLINYGPYPQQPLPNTRLLNPLKQ